MKYILYRTYDGETEYVSSYDTHEKVFFLTKNKAESHLFENELLAKLLVEKTSFEIERVI